jgi:hypothetical protein
MNVSTVIFAIVYAVVGATILVLVTLGSETWAVVAAIGFGALGLHLIWSLGRYLYRRARPPSAPEEQG